MPEAVGNYTNYLGSILFNFILSCFFLFTYFYFYVKKYSIILVVAYSLPV